MKQSSLKRIFSYTLKFKWSFFISVLDFIAFAAADIAAVDGIRRVISYIDSGDNSLNTLLSLALIFIAIGRGIGFFVGNYFMSRVGFGIVHDLRADLFQKLHDLPKSYFDANQSGQLINRITFTTTQVSAAASSAILRGGEVRGEASRGATPLPHALASSPSSAPTASSPL